MPVELAQIEVADGEHAVAFYAHDAELAATVGRYAGAAIGCGETAILAASDAHLRAFTRSIEGTGIDVAAARRSGRLVTVDAGAALARLMPSGRVEGDRFDELIGGIVRQAVATRRPVRVYGELVALLWDRGDVLSAIELEGLWNELGAQLSFSLLCAYPVQSVSSPERAEELERVCRLHNAVHHRPSPGCGQAPLPLRQELAAVFASAPGTPCAARRLLVETLLEWGVRAAAVEDAALVLTELVTNAVVHAATPLSLQVVLDASLLRISVADGVAAAPRLRYGGPAAESGRGLQLVASVSSDWGVERTAGGKRVWAEFALAR